MKIEAVIFGLVFLLKMLYQIIVTSTGIIDGYTEIQTQRERERERERERDLSKMIANGAMTMVAMAWR